MAIAKELRQRVRERANYLCEYCHSSEEASAARFEIDHIQPRSLGGLDTFENLALACQRCNSYRYNFTEGTDPKSQVSTPLFNPRLRRFPRKNIPHFFGKVRGQAAHFPKKWEVLFQKSPKSVE